jgi:hypothetical protein
MGFNENTFQKRCVVTAGMIRRIQGDHKSAYRRVSPFRVRLPSFLLLEQGN